MGGATLYLEQCFLRCQRKFEAKKEPIVDWKKQEQKVWKRGKRWMKKKRPNRKEETTGRCGKKEGAVALSVCYSELFTLLAHSPSLALHAQ